MLHADKAQIEGGEVTFKVAYLKTEYDPTLVYGVETTIETLTNTRLSCIHISHPKVFTPRLEAVDFAVFVMTMTMYESHLSVSQLSRLEVDRNQQLANRNDPYMYVSPLECCHDGLLGLGGGGARPAADFESV